MPSKNILSANTTSSTHMSSRQPSPQPFQQSLASTSTSASLLDLTQSEGQTTTKPSNSNAADEEWTFASALPKQPSQIAVLSSSIKIMFSVVRDRTDDGDILIHSSISNNCAQPITNLTFQLAVSKVCFLVRGFKVKRLILVQAYKLKLEPQSGRNLLPKQINGITQTMGIQGVGAGKGNSVKLRWKVSYFLAGQAREEQGELASLGVA